MPALIDIEILYLASNKHKYVSQIQFNRNSSQSTAKQFAVGDCSASSIALLSWSIGTDSSSHTN